MMDNGLKEIDLLNNVQDNFNLHNLGDYQKLLYIIYNNFYVQENAPQLSKYKIFSILDTLIKKFNMNDECIMSANNETNLEEDYLHKYINNQYYDYFVSYKLLQNSPRYLIKNNNKDKDKEKKECKS